jgi:hypothetical protein
MAISGTPRCRASVWPNEECVGGAERKPTAESREQRAESREQRAESREQRAESKAHRPQMDVGFGTIYLLGVQRRSVDLNPGAERKDRQISKESLR